MFGDRARAESFGRVAELYDRARPRYPDALLEVVLAGARSVLDVGAGTGIAARQLADRGARVLAIEPDPRMAAVARAHGLEVEIATFERWQPVGRRFELVTAGQAWHWVDPERGAAKAATVLEPGGRLGVFWNYGELPDDLRAPLASIYERLAPELPNYGAKPGGGRANLDAAIAGIAASGAFAEPSVRVFPWAERYDAAAWRALLGTHSDHLALPDARRERLLDAVDEAIEAAGGSLLMPYEATLVEASLR